MENFLALQRLAIIDPASGDQPLYNEDKAIVVTGNGEIYNHEELRKRLPNHKFRTGSDCDVIAHLYEEYGENFVDMLDGMFSFVLFDTRNNSFIAARDAIGITSLYIGWGLDETLSPLQNQICMKGEPSLNSNNEQFSYHKPYALKALFGISLYPLNRTMIVEFGAVPPLFSLVVKDGRVGIVEDATVVIAQVAGCEESGEALLWLGFWWICWIRRQDRVGGRRRTRFRRC